MHTYTASMRARGVAPLKLAEMRTLNDPRAGIHTYNGPNTYHDALGSLETNVSALRSASRHSLCRTLRLQEARPVAWLLAWQCSPASGPVVMQQEA
jgi:hypothetical protein